MRLEETRDIANKLAENTPEGSAAHLWACELWEKANSAIAERALPVTREWLDANFKRIDGEFVAESRHGKIVIWLRTDGKLRLSVLSSSYAIDTRGDLLDILSGLGVRK